MVCIIQYIPLGYRLLGLPKEIIGEFFCYVQGNESQSLSDALKDIAMIPFNFSFKENHMWYIYLLIGLYLYMPFFSAWIEKADRSKERVYLGIWFVSLFLPYMSALYQQIFIRGKRRGINSACFIISQDSTDISY